MEVGRGFVAAVVVSKRIPCLWGWCWWGLRRDETFDGVR